MERQYLLKTDPPDDRDKPFKSFRTEFPEEVDLRPKDFPEILDQGWLGACTGYSAIAIAQCIEYIQSQIHSYYYLNPLYVYYKARELMGTTEEDSGAYIRDALKTLKNVGVCTISRYASKEVNGEAVLDLSRFKEKPSAEADENATFHKIKSYSRIMQVSQLKQALADGHLVNMGIEIYNSFESDEVAKTGIVPMPDKAIEYSLGGHAVAAYGYKKINDVEYIIVRNSWGKEWGDKGFFYLPMAYIGRYVSDMWIVE